MIEMAALNQALRTQHAKLDGWGPPGADVAQAGRRRTRSHSACDSESGRPYAVNTPRSSRAVRAALSALIPSLSRTSAPGALAPKRSIDTLRSTQRSHP